MASRTRSLEEHGIPLEFDHIQERNRGVEAVLDEAEKKHPGLGLALLEHFFPGGAHHEHHWNVLRSRLEEARDKKVADAAAKAKENLAGRGPELDRWEPDELPNEVLVFGGKAGRYIFTRSSDGGPASTT